MAVTISYKNSKISEINNSNTRTLETAGKYCESNIIINYNKEGNKIVEGNSSIVITDAEEGDICALTQYGACEQDSSTNAISCNNGVLSISSGEIITTGTNETVTVGSQTATIENLYSVGNIKDEQEIVTGRVTRKNDICIYDGTQSVGDRYISSTGAKDNGAIIIYPREEEYNGEDMVSFSKNTEEDINSLEVNISPIQSLNGYKNPWPGGGGKNKYKTTLATQTKNGVTATVDADGFIHLSGTASATTIFPLGGFTFSAGEYYITMCPPGGSATTYRVYANWGSNDTGNGWTRTFTEGEQRNFQLNINSGINVDGLVCKPMICLSSAGTDFAPYENICPISGRTGLNVYRTGFNLCQDSVHINHFWESGELKTNKNANYAAIDIKVPVAPGEDYCVYVPDNTSGGRVYVSFFDASESFIGQENYTIGSTNVFTATADTRFIAISFYKNGGVSVGERICVSLSGANDGTYETYNGSIYSVDWSTQAGTVYGGTLDVVTGLLTIDRIGVDGGSVEWTKTTGNQYRNFSFNPSPLAKYMGSQGTVISSQYKSKANSTVGASDDNYVWIRGSSTNNTVCVKDTSKASLSASDFKTAMTGVQFVWEISTPLTYQLTPQEVQTLIGQNNIFSPDATSIKVAVSNPRIEQVTPQPLTLAEGNNTITATNLNVSSVPLKLEYIVNGDNLLYGSNTSNYANAGAADYMII